MKFVACSKKWLFVPITVLACSAASAPAAVILSIDNVQVAPGSVAEVGVYASSNSSDVLTGFNLPLDLNHDGYSAGALPAGFSLDASPLQNELYSTSTDFDNTNTTELSIIAADAIPTGSGADTVLSSTPTLLFDLAIDVSPDAAIGSELPLDIFIPTSIPSLFNIAGSPKPSVLAPTSGAPALGSVTVVPEPSILGLTAPMLLALKRRSRAGVRN